MKSQYVDRSLELLMAVPARSQHERDAWICRGLTEFGLVVEASGGPPEHLDRAVYHARLQEAPKRFAVRLAGLRSRTGNVPTWYPHPVETDGDDRVSDAATVSDAITMLRFADGIRQGSSVDPEIISALGGAGERAFTEFEAWRPTRGQGGRPRFLEIADLSPDHLWRGWMMTPSGPTMVVADERLSPNQMGVWWGVHNGTHLDHLCAGPSQAPHPIEYGCGLLTAEALAMSAELLAGAEASIEGRVELCSVISDGLVERVGRLVLPPRLGADPLYMAAMKARSDEFASLPTLAEAYVRGCLDLIRRHHANPLIPEEISYAFEQRWQEASMKSSLVERFLRDVRTRDNGDSRGACDDRS